MAESHDSPVSVCVCSVTLEDVLEKLFQRDIRDETDSPFGVRPSPTLLYHGHLPWGFPSHRALFERSYRGNSNSGSNSGRSRSDPTCRDERSDVCM